VNFGDIELYVPDLLNETAKQIINKTILN